MLGFSASMGRFYQPVLMIAFYALSGFFQAPAARAAITITKWTPRRKRGTFLDWNISHNLGGAGAGVALFGANYRSTAM